MKKDEGFPADVLAGITERHSKAETETGGVGNLLRLVRENVGEEIKSARAERDLLVAKVLELNARIVTLETHQQVGANGETGARA